MCFDICMKKNTMTLERHGKLFKNGRNQAVRIPREFELAGDPIEQSVKVIVRLRYRLDDDLAGLDPDKGQRTAFLSFLDDAGGDLPVEGDLVP